MRHEWFDTGLASPTRRRAAAASWLARLAALFLLVSVLAHRFGAVETPEFFWLLAAGGLMPLLVLVLGASALRRAWRQGEAGAGRAAAAMMLAVLMLVPYCLAGWLVWQLPALDDVATDALDPPQFLLLRRLRTPAMNVADPITEEEARAQAETYPGVTGRRYPAAPDLVESAIGDLLAARGWTLRARHATGELETTLEVAGRSFLFGFPFDLAIRITDEEETTYVDLRSAIPYGAHDLGFNARRIQDFLAVLDVEMATRAGGGNVEEEQGAARE